MLLPLASKAFLLARLILSLSFGFSPLRWCVIGLDGTQNDHECLFLAVSTLSCFYTVIASLSDPSSLLRAPLTTNNKLVLSGLLFYFIEPSTRNTRSTGATSITANAPDVEWSPLSSIDISSPALLKSRALDTGIDFDTTCTCTSLSSMSLLQLLTTSLNAQTIINGNSTVRL
ncbi:hypothetical protein BDN70DRAFT_887774 [Pholiota conissans]|uniref:Uncharacterized protein n=1 Tax=Pholiota conissans TaxID=109636 RepID=A0A9P5YPT7_9AGAR|nr:hypothetical protein BDN70DRAFT_887774 [Pholiota conissans]